jgi:hypothetical protein
MLDPVFKVMHPKTDPGGVTRPQTWSQHRTAKAALRSLISISRYTPGCTIHCSRDGNVYDVYQFRELTDAGFFNTERYL